MPRSFSKTITTCSSTWNSDHSKNGKFLPTFAFRKGVIL